MTTATPFPGGLDSRRCSVHDVGGDSGWQRTVARGITRGLFRPLFLTPFALPRLAGRAMAVLPTGRHVTTRWHDLQGVDTLEVVFGTPGRPPLLYFHGGGYCVGSPATDQRLAARLSEASGRPVWLPAYRLAPEHRFPAALDDALTTARELYDRFRLPIALGGDSAGGGLAMAAAMQLRDDGDVPVSHLALISPWLDLTMSGGPAPGRDDPMMSRRWLASNAVHYAGDDLANPRVSPIFGDLGGLPPVHIEVGTDEHLYADSQRAFHAIGAAGGTATLVQAHGYWHVFQIFAGMLAAADQSIARLGEFLRARVG